MEQASRPVLVGLGCPILDIKAAVSEEFLATRGLALRQFSVTTDCHRAHALYREAVDSGARIQYSAGGSTQNVIRVAQWLLGAGHRCAFVGSVGDDDFARLLRREVEAEGSAAAFCYVGTPGHATGNCLALTLAGDKEDRRHQLFTAGASETFDFASLAEDTKQVIDGASYVYLECAFLAFAADHLLALAQRSKDQSKCVVVNLSNISVVNKHRDAILRLLPLADVVFAKEKEALALAPAQTPEEAALILSRRRGSDTSIVVVTRGTQPTVVACEGQASVFAVPVVPKEKIVDLIGSGDAFVGGFLAAFVHRHHPKTKEVFAHHHHLAQCVASGHFASSEVIQHAGCMFSSGSTRPPHNEPGQ
ncbi:kinase, pfkB superfamily protein [Acanthamoeba castellanii str. Neff]|uniref:Adenosine kinase n=1 Tax=Acanthamoeba castellanii (strain ATCC 30010 / Neff) TaxID=1257118 RepID=L8GEI1_ACACF|nr:kinase, pfkB superfamily protein [Acanthamoeba castellanii str. Neff]ELR11098.1 kinase, pfkB superfamily protein [Acanthamoeba castellanii str. Neff]